MIPCPPACATAAHLADAPNGAPVAVAGLVICRQRPGSAKGVLFVTLEDETGVVNVVVWAKVYEANRRAVLASRLMRVSGRLQREGDVIHVVAFAIEDISALLDTLAAPGPARALALEPALARADEVRRPQPQGSRPAAGGAVARAAAHVAAVVAPRIRP